MSLSDSMYKEQLYGNVREIGFVDDPLFIGMGLITGSYGQLKLGFTITKEAVDAVMSQWGKTTGKKAVNASSKSAARGFVFEK